MEPREHSGAYASPAMRSLLRELAALRAVADGFFLTGGTALSVFHLHHRLSEDLDLFTARPADLSGLRDEIRRAHPRDAVTLGQGPTHLRMLVAGVKVDFAIDPLSGPHGRARCEVAPGVSLAIDGLPDIAANKLSAAASRGEIKDFLDLHFLVEAGVFHDPARCFDEAARRDGLFDDPPTAAWQIEENFRRCATLPRPKLLRPLEEAAFPATIARIADLLYRRITPPVSG